MMGTMSFAFHVGTCPHRSSYSAVGQDWIPPEVVHVDRTTLWSPRPSDGPAVPDAESGSCYPMLFLKRDVANVSRADAITARNGN